MNRLERIQQSFTKKAAPSFEIGDTVRVHVKVVEGEKERIQVFEGAVIARKGLLNTETFTVRKVSYGVGVERIFPLHSPIVTRVEVMRQGKVRRAKLYYLRGKKGKFAMVTGHYTEQGSVADVLYVTESTSNTVAVFALLNDGIRQVATIGSARN